jgi:hypothetical protein
MNKITSILITLLVQLTVVGLVFLGFLLDPLLSIWVVGIYFSVVGSFLTYYFLSRTNCRVSNIY